MSHPSRRAARHFVPTWLLVLAAGIGLVLVLASGGDHAAVADASSRPGEPVPDAGFTFAALTALAYYAAFAALVVMLVLELRRRRTHVQG